MMINDGWVKTTCAYCGVGCGVEARPNTDGLLDIRGDKQHPSNYGKLCTKGVALGDTVITDGRLLFPTRFDTKSSNDGADLSSNSKSSNPSRTAVDMDWSEATQLIADKFQQAITEFGADSVAFYVSGQLLTEDYYVANKLMKGFIGSGNIDSNSRLCMASSVVGHKRAFGSDTVPICYDDLEHAELVIITGSNLAWCHPVLFQRLRSAKQNNPQLKIVVIDPRSTATCELADLHLPIQSGSDVALFNGLLSYLYQHNKLDLEYINQHTDGFEHALESALQHKDLSQLTGLASSVIENFYHLFSNSEKVITVYSQGVNQSSQGSDKVSSILNCHLATGKIGKKGCGPFSITGQPNAMGGREVGGLANTLAAHMEFNDPNHHQIISDFWQTDNLATQPGLKAIDLFDAMEAGKIKAIWIMATNPVVSLPNSKKIESALEACPFVVVSDCIADTETTRFADVILPAQGWSEKSGTVTNSERRISRQRRLFPSPGLARPDWWIISQVAKKMGFAKAFDYLHEGEVFKEYARLTAVDNTKGDNRGLTLSGLVDLDTQEYNALTPQQWPVLKKQDHIIHQRMFSDHQFFTPNKKAQFIATTHASPLSHLNAEHPLILNSGRSRDHWHTMSRTGLSARLSEHSPEPYVMIHPETANRHNLKPYDIATIYNDHNQIQARVEISSTVAPKQLFMPIHWNNTTAKNSKPCDLILPNADLDSGQPEFKHTPVNIKPWHYRCEALFISKQTVDLTECDYWVKQKVDNGYLYRIASLQDPLQLTLTLSQYLTTNPEKILSQQGGQHSPYRLATIKSHTIHSAFVVQEKISGGDKTWLQDLFATTKDNAEEQFWGVKV